MPKISNLHELKNAINRNGCKEFVEKIGKKTSLQAWANVIEGISSEDVSSLCEALQNKVQSALDLIEGLATPEPQVHNGSTPMPIPATPTKVATLELVGHTIAAVANIATALLLETLTSVPSCLFELAVLLHDRCIMELGDNILDAAQSAVVGLCCTWWQHNITGKEELVPQALTFILVQGYQRAKPADIKLCCTMREMLTMCSFEDASINDIKRLLLRTFMRPRVLQNAHGRKFLGFLLTLDAALVGEICAIMRNQIPAGKMWMLEAFGDIIYRGWREAEGSIKLEVERTCIQDLARAALSASSTSLAASLRVVLNGIHANKRVADVDSMLVRLYEPIIFRALSAANPGVRLNALLLLLDAFPLMDTESSTEEDMTSLLVQQFTSISDALTDPVVPIRCAAAQGVCQLLNLYWEIIPSATAAAYLCRLSGELAFDKSSPAVRIATLKGLALLVDNKLAQPVLKTVLPRLGSLIADKHVKVRQALAELLLTASSCRELAVHDVVPLDIMVEIMGRDEPSVVATIQQLVLPCYFPTPEEGLAHVPALLKRDPDAGAAFCRWLAAGPTDTADGVPRYCIALEHIVDLASALMQHLLSAEQSVEQDDEEGDAVRPAKRPATGKGRGRAAPKQKGRKKRKGAGKAEEERTVQPNNLSVAEWEAMLRGLKELCHGLELRLQQLDEKGAADSLNSILPEDSLVQLLMKSKSPKARTYVWQLAALFPSHRAAQELSDSCMELLESEGRLFSLLSGMDESEGKCEEMEAMLLCLCNQQQAATCLLAALRCSLKNEEPEHMECPEVACSSDAACSVCGEEQPEDELLLCDGCDASWHMTCVSPPVEELPDGLWFCPCCIQHIARLGMSQDAATRCLQIMLDMPSLRKKLLDTPYFVEMLRPLAESTDSLFEIMIARLHQDPSDTAQADTAPAPAVSVQSATPNPKRRSKRSRPSPSADTDRRHADEAGVSHGTTPGCSTRKKKTAHESESDANPAVLPLLFRLVMHLILDGAARSSEQKKLKNRKKGEEVPGPLMTTPQLVVLMCEVVLGCTDVAVHLCSRIAGLDDAEQDDLPQEMQDAVQMITQALALCTDAMQLRTVFASTPEDSRAALRAFNGLVVQCLKILECAVARGIDWDEDCMLVHMKASTHMLESLIIGAQHLSQDQPARAAGCAAVQLEPLLGNNEPSDDYRRDACEVAKHLLMATTADKSAALLEVLKPFNRRIVNNLLKQGTEIPCDWLHPVVTTVASPAPPDVSEDRPASPELGGGRREQRADMDSPSQSDAEQQGLPPLAKMLLDTTTALKVPDVLQARLVDLAHNTWPAADWEGFLGALRMLTYVGAQGVGSPAPKRNAAAHCKLQQLVSTVRTSLASEQCQVPLDRRPPLQALVARLA